MCCCLLFVPLPSVYLVLCLCWRTAVCRCSSFLLIWCLYFQIVNNSHVVRICFLSVVLFECSLCTVTCSQCLTVCIMFSFCFCLYHITHHACIRCLMFWGGVSLFCVVLLLKNCLSLIFFLINAMFVFSICKQQPHRSYIFLLCSIVWIFSLHSYLFVRAGCLYVGSYVVFACLLLHIQYLFVVCCCFCRMFVLCCVSVEILLLVVVLLFVSMMFVFLANNGHVVRVIILSVVSFEFPFCTVTCSSFWLFVFGVLFVFLLLF